MSGISDDFTNWMSNFLTGSSPDTQTPPTPTSGAGQMGPPDFSGSNFVPNGDGTYTDTSTGIMYDANGTSLGNDSSLTGAIDAGNATAPGGLGGLLSGLGSNGLATLAGLLGPAIAGIYGANQTGKATGQVTQGITNAQNAVQGLLGQNNAYAPYTQAGSSALNKLGSLGFQPTNFASLGQAGALTPNITLGNIAASVPAAKKGR